jgi:hypothetical protein
MRRLFDLLPDRFPGAVSVLVQHENEEGIVFLNKETTFAEADAWWGRGRAGGGVGECRRTSEKAYFTMHTKRINK